MFKQSAISSIKSIFIIFDANAVLICAMTSQIRHQGRVHDYVVQCALSINLFNEKIFALVLFWLATVAVATTSA